MHRTMLAASPVPAAVAGNAIAASLVTELANAGHITAQFNFDYGSGGTSATYWLQTSLDGGATWIDIACVQFTTADAVKIVNIDAGGYVTPGYVPGDGTLAVGSVVDGIMGDRLRVKQTIVGSYANSTISVDVVDKAGVGGPKTVTQVGAPAALGQAAASASMPVVITNEQSAIPIKGLAAENISDGGVVTIARFSDVGSTARALASVDLKSIGGAGGQTVARSYSANVFKTVALSAATAEATIWTPTTATKFRLLGFVLTASAQTVLTFKDNTGGTTILVVELAANVPFTFNLGAFGIPSAAVNNVLTVTRGTSAILNGTVYGTEGT